MQQRVWSVAMALAVAGGLVIGPLYAHSGLTAGEETMAQADSQASCPPLVAGAATQEPASLQPVISESIRNDTSPPLSSITPVPPPPGEVREIEIPLGRPPPPASDPACDALPGEQPR